MFNADSMESMWSCTSNSNSTPLFEQCGRFSPCSKTHSHNCSKTGFGKHCVVELKPWERELLSGWGSTLVHMEYRREGLHLLTLQQGVTWASIEVREVSGVNLSQYYSSASLVMSYEFFSRST